MDVFSYAEHILLNGGLENKLLNSDVINWDLKKSYSPIKVNEPTRDKNIAFSKEQIKFPGKGALKDPKQRGKALHFFANHELLAIEMMAQAILLFTDWSPSQQKLVVKTLSEEQKHFSLYLGRMRDFGVEFGDYPLNSFFWNFMDKIESSDQFFSVISLTFEQANLDFARHYMNVFQEIGDGETFNILKEVYEDEVRHVARGRTELIKKVDSPEDLWNHYCESLPENLTPARAKGIIFDRDGRKKAGLDLNFIESLHEYKNNFSITNRKQWKS